MINQETIDRIIETAKIEEVIGDFVALRRRGANFIACCPFHDEKTPSFSVSPAKGIFKCFGCGKAGNAVSFVMEHEHLSYVESLKYLAKKYNIEFVEKEETAEEIQNRLYNESLLIVNEFAQKFFTQQLFETDEGKAVGLSYFKERGFNDNTIKKFALGYAPDSKRSLTHAAQRAGYKNEHLVGTGLTIERENGELLDRYYDRVIFPIRGLSGKVIAFGGRKLKGDKNIAKYINSPESAIYVKNKVLYGIYEAKSAIAKEQKCYLVEGYTDVISFFQSGIENVVASSGTSLTTGQIHLIKRFTNNVTVLYDGDFAGIKASLRGIDMLLDEGMQVKVALFPDGEDPDSFAQSHSQSELKEFLQNAEEDFISFKYRVLSNDAGTDPLKKAQIINDIIESISHIQDPITRTVYVEQTAKQMNIREDMLQVQVEKLRRKRQENATTANKSSSDSSEIKNNYREENNNIDNGVYALEKEVIYYLISYGRNTLNFNQRVDELGHGISDKVNVAEFIKNQLGFDEIELQHNLYKRIYDEYFLLDVEKYNTNEKVFTYFTLQKEPEIISTIINITNRPYEIIKPFESSIRQEQTMLESIIPKTINLYKCKVIVQTINTLTQALKTTTNEEELKEIMMQISNLNKVKTEFSKAVNRITI